MRTIILTNYHNIESATLSVAVTIAANTVHLVASIRAASTRAASARAAPASRSGWGELKGRNILIVFRWNDGSRRRVPATAAAAAAMAAPSAPSTTTVDSVDWGVAHVEKLLETLRG